MNYVNNSLKSTNDVNSKPLSFIYNDPMNGSRLAYSGRLYDIIVPGYSSGSNASIDNTGWATIGKPLENRYRITDAAGIVAGYGNNTLSPTAESSVGTLADGVNKLGSADSTKKAILRGGGVSAFIELANAIANNISFESIKIVLQKSGNETRAIIQIGNTKNALSKSGEYYCAPKSDVELSGFYQAGIVNGLKDAGYGKYVGTGFFTDTNIKAILTKAHDSSPYNDYISFNSAGNMEATPIIYKGDKGQIVTYNNFDGFTWGEKATYTFSNEQFWKASSVNPGQSNYITKALNNLGISVLTK